MGPLFEEMPPNIWWWIAVVVVLQLDIQGLLGRLKWHPEFCQIALQNLFASAMGLTLSSRLIFQHNNGPKHTNKSWFKKCQNVFCFFLQWPSPDLHPIPDLYLWFGEVSPHVET